MDKKQNEKSVNGWKPAVGESYFFAEFSQGYFVFEPSEVVLGVEDNDEYDFPIFRKVDECRAFCNKLNEAIKKINP